MRIAELYVSLQGEGLLAGTPSVFVRSSGCNLRCHWCDTPFTSWKPVGEEWGIERIVAAVVASGHRHVVLTGGEPLLFEDAIPLVNTLRRTGHHVTVETAGTILPDRLPTAPWTDLV
ncbi:MAG: 7-carboxy-7-deazaguanine synthase QueE, partial [Pirellulales bacterium]